MLLFNAILALKGSGYMRISKEKVLLAATRNCQTLNAVRKKAGLNCQTFYKATRGENVRTDTAGKIARALGVNAAEILKEGVSNDT